VKNYKIDDSLWKAYVSTYFYFPQEFSASEFAIITAWNPKSQLLSYEDNNSNNKRLSLAFKNCRWATVLAGDALFEWVEESFAVEIDIECALNLARQFKQNASVYVRNENVFLHSCIDTRCSELGALSTRIFMPE
jgi:hypothetical protein